VQSAANSMQRTSVYPYFRATCEICKNLKWHYMSSRTRCNVCGKPTVFLCLDGKDPWIRRCIWCRSTPKYRAIVHTIADWAGIALKSFLQTHKVYELSSTSPIHRLYNSHPNYICSAYCSDHPFGTKLSSGVWNEDLQRLSFPDNSFDLIISSETMEHVRRPWRGFSEIARVLRPGGAHCYTVPYHGDRTTASRVDTSAEEDVYLYPKVYHLDPHKPEDSLVYTDFGRDLPEILRVCGFSTEQHSVWSEAYDIRDDLSPVTVFVSVKGPIR